MINVPLVVFGELIFTRNGQYWICESNIGYENGDEIGRYREKSEREAVGGVETFKDWSVFGFCEEGKCNMSS